MSSKSLSSKPRGIIVDVNSKQMQITWESGHTSVYDFGYLRRACPCAECMPWKEGLGEVGKTPQSVLDDLAELKSPNDVIPIGAYAIQFNWSSGHAWGIYNWEYLFELCPCPDTPEKKEMTDITPQLSIWVQQLRAIAQIGLAFEPRIYDRERYEALLRLAATMAATMNAGATLDVVLADEFQAQWRAQVKTGTPGYVTPKVGAGAVVFNAKDEILLVQRAEGPWFIPTGWGDVGISPAQVATKEVREETGFIVKPERVMGVYDGAQWGASLDPHFYSIVFYCKLVGGSLKRHPAETLDAGFFARDKLPAMIWRNRQKWFEHAWAFHCGETTETYFDR